MRLRIPAGRIDPSAFALRRRTDRLAPARHRLSAGSRQQVRPALFCLSIEESLSLDVGSPPDPRHRAVLHRGRACPQAVWALRIEPCQNVGDCQLTHRRASPARRNGKYLASRCRLPTGKLLDETRRLSPPPLQETSLGFFEERSDSYSAGGCERAAAPEYYS